MLRKIKYKLEVLSKLKPYSYGVKRFFVINLFLSIITILLSFINPLFYKAFVEQVILQGKIEALTVIIIGYLSLNSIKDTNNVIYEII